MRTLLLFSGLLHLPLIRTFQCCVLSTDVSSTIYFSLWYGPMWDLTRVFRAIGEHTNHIAHGSVIDLESFSEKGFLGNDFKMHMMFRILL